MSRERAALAIPKIGWFFLETTLGSISNANEFDNGGNGHKTTVFRLDFDVSSGELLK